MDHQNTTISGIQASDRRFDDELLSCVAHGSAVARAEAFDAFYHRHQQYLYGICYNLANRYQFGCFDADDIFQQTMSKVFENAATFICVGLTDQQDLLDAADAWLGGIAENVVFDLLRRTPMCVSIESLLVEASDDQDPPAFEALDPSLDFESDDAALIRQAIDTLSPNEKAVIWAMSQFYQCREHQHTPSEGLKEITQSLGISKQNFRKIRQRAKEKISEYMLSKKTATEAK